MAGEGEFFLPRGRTKQGVADALPSRHASAHIAGMNTFTGFVVFVLVWWTTLFCVLPIGVRPDADGQETPGGWRGAPAKAHLGWRLLATTVLTALIWVGLYYLIESDWLSFRSGLFAMPTR